MSTTDQILGSRNDQFPTVGQPTGMSDKYYTLVDTSTNPATTTIKERSPLGNMFDRSVGTIQGDTYSSLKGNDTEDAFFSNAGLTQAQNAAKATSVYDLYTNNNPHFPGTQNNSEATLSATNKALSGNSGLIPKVNDIPGSAAKLANVPGKPGTRNKFPGASGTEPLIFPIGLGQSQQDIIQFNMMKFKPRKMEDNTKRFGWADRAKNRDNTSTIIGSVVLPIPAGIGDNQTVSWGGNNMNALNTELAKMALAGIDKGVDAAIDSLSKSVDKVANNSDEVKSGIALALAGAATGNEALVTRSAGVVMNPNMELLFGGPSLRPFSFNFQLSPRSAKEAQSVIKIIRFFKQGMSAIRSKSNLFLKSPHTFQIRYKHRGRQGQEHKYLNKFKECALMGFGVQYTPTGNYSTFSDGVMTQYQISMQFQELEPIFNDDYGNGPFPTEIGY